MSVVLQLAGVKGLMAHYVCVCTSYHVNEMPIVLIFGIATTIDSVHRALPHRVTSLLSMKKFEAPSSSDYLSTVLHSVSNSTDTGSVAECLFTMFHLNLFAEYWSY